MNLLSTLTLLASASLLTLCGIASAKEASDTELLTLAISNNVPQPVSVYKLPNRGGIAVALDNLAIKSGVSGSILNARDALAISNSNKGTLVFSCADEHSTLSIKKALEMLQGKLTFEHLNIFVANEADCPNGLYSAIESSGAKLANTNATSKNQ